MWEHSNVLDAGGYNRTWKKSWKKAIRFGTGKKTVIMKYPNPKLPHTKQYQPAKYWVHCES